jgi:integrase
MLGLFSEGAGRRLHELLHTLEQGAYVRPSRLTVAQFLGEWLRDYARPNTAPRTCERYEEIMRVHLIPALGSFPLLALQPHHIQKYYAQALETGRRDDKGGLSALTIHKHHRILYESLRYGVRQGILVRNPAEAVTPPHGQSKKPAMVGANHMHLILEAAKETPYYALFYTALFTGMRRSELLALRWCDIDFIFSQVYVNRSLHHLKDGSYVFTQPKSVKSRRTIALSPSAILTRAWSTIAKRAGVKVIRLHDARHTHASLMLKQGAHPKVVSERLGHSTITTTLDIYSHVTPGLQEAAARRFDEVLKVRHNDIGEPVH